MGEVLRLEDEIIRVSYDQSLYIATASSRRAKYWKNKEVTWSRLLKLLSKSTETSETLAEYKNMPKGEQARIKDIGGFVGGELKEGRRLKSHVKSRTVLTLDADFNAAMLRFDLRRHLRCAYCVHSTHKHSDTMPRLRVIIPLDRAVSAEEHEAIARKVAEIIGMDYFDSTAFMPHQMAFWPSHPRDITPVFEYVDAPILSADSVLAMYPDWKDVSYYPTAQAEVLERKRAAEKQADPTKKDGLVGVFCRTYTIKEAIDTFLGDVYEPCAAPDRYTYVNGSTAAGLVLYDDRFAYSNHATDPASGQLCNAFDLVRIHLFGMKDEDPSVGGSRSESYKAMVEFIQQDARSIKQLQEERDREVAEDFSELPEGMDTEWMQRLTRKKGSIDVDNTINNLVLIMRNDPIFQSIAYNQLADNLEIIGDVPWQHTRFWRDADDAQVEVYLAAKYGEFSKAKIETAFTKTTDDRSYHPVREYIEQLPPWDGVKRLDTMLVRYLNADDTKYTRTVSRKFMCAMIKRVLKPGVKFDPMLVLVGGQGIGKSTFLHKLGREWHDDNLSISDIRDKTAAEKIQGVILMEISEMAGMRKMEVEAVKGFVSRQVDRYRAAYGRRTQAHPRQCVFAGTTNAEEGFLRDATGGRRFWPVECRGVKDKEHEGPWHMTDEEIEQLWAEALYLVERGERLELSKEEEELARDMQQRYIEEDPRQGLIEKYLDTLLPSDWNRMTLEERRDFLDSGEEGTELRTTVSGIEIWAEALRKNPADYMKKDAHEITTIMAKIGGWEKEGLKRIHLYNTQRLYRRV